MSAVPLGRRLTRAANELRDRRAACYAAISARRERTPLADLGPDDPGLEHRTNWLPTPAHQRFELSLRAYWPDDALLQDHGSPPAVVPVP